MSTLDTIIGLLAPHECITCGQEGSLLCQQCLAALPIPTSCCYRCQRPTEGSRTCSTCRCSSALRWVIPATDYETDAKTLVHRLKFERAQAAATSMAEVMAARLSLSSPWLLVPVPTVAARVRVRGYDQAHLLARRLAHQLHCPTSSALQRRSAVRQLGQSGTVRRKQMAGAFTVLQSGVVENNDVLLIDDVLTTGATLEAAAQALHQAGARQVAAVVFARA